MTPDFALSLSFEGIRLLHRGPGGWTPVGEVPLDSRNLSGDLAALRRAGLALGAPWQGTKLLLPEEQIRTLTLNDPEAGLEAARAALDGATPYAVDDLVIDQVSDGTRTHVAAVARETLEEAFAFAAEHGFQPVSFAAQLGADFPGEAFFGPTRIAGSVLKGETVTREAPAGTTTPVPDPEDDTPQIHRAPKPALVAAVPEEVPPAVEPASPRLAQEPSPGPSPELLVAAPPAPEPEAAATEPPDAGPTAPPATTPVAPPPPRAGTPLTAARPDASRARPLRGETRTPPPATKPDAASRPPRDGDRVEPRPGQRAASAPLAAPPDTARRASPVVPPKASGPARPEPRLASSAVPVAAAAPPMAATTSAEALAATLQAPRRDGPPDAATPARTPFRLGRKDEAANRVGGRPRYLGLVLTAVLLVIMATVAVLAAVSDRTLASLFQRGQLPEVAAAPPSEAPAEVTALAAPAADVPSTPQPDVEAAAAAVAAALAEMPKPTSPEGAEAVLAASDVWLDGPGQIAEPEAVAASGTSLTPDSAGAASPAPLPTLAALAPDAALATPEAAPTPRPEEPAAEPPALASTEAHVDPPATPAPTPVAEAPPAFADATPAAGVPVLGAVRPADRPLSVASAEPAAPAPEAIEVVAGLPPVVPPKRPGSAPADTGSAWANAMAEAPGKAPRLRPQDLVPSELAETAPAQGGIPLQPDAPEDLLAALAPGAEPLAGAPGLTDPAVEGALAFATTVQPDTPLVAPGGVSLAGLRPTPRPENLAPAEEPAPEELAAWDGPRPGLRPEGLAPEAAPSPEVDDAVAQALETPEAPADAPAAEAPAAAPQQPDVQTALAAIVANSPDPLAGATRQAVPQARRPDTRPANFGRVVATQLDRLARSNAPRQAAIAPPAAQASTAGNLAANEQAESAPEVASSAAAAPSGPTAASVAQAATFQDVIALREVNLIGVYGQPNARRALVRMGNGSYLRVGVGDSLDGGQVTAIGDNALNYVKRGRTYALAIPGG